MKVSYKLKQVLASSRAAIDLASIMVGIIVIGLIGGVIAATVFTVIPWAQDNAAKQQLANITQAQNAHAGLTAEEGGGFGTLTDGTSTLASKGLMQANPDTYCSVPTDDGNHFTSFALSGSGKVWTSTDRSPNPVVFTGDMSATCLTGAPEGPAEEEAQYWTIQWIQFGDDGIIGPDSYVDTVAPGYSMYGVEVRYSDLENSPVAESYRTVSVDVETGEELVGYTFVPWEGHVAVNVLSNLDRTRSGVYQVKLEGLYEGEWKKIAETTAQRFESVMPPYLESEDAFLAEHAPEYLSLESFKKSRGLEWMSDEWIREMYTDEREMALENYTYEIENPQTSWWLVAV